MTTNVILLMILIALVTAAVLLLHRPHSRSSEQTRNPVRHQGDADFRRVRADLWSVAGRLTRLADQVLALPGTRSADDRARAELMEPKAVSARRE